MDRADFWKAIKELRKSICEGYNYDHRNKKLDDVIETVTEGGIMTESLDLEQDVVRVIKRIKEAKEDELMKEQANVLIDKIKKEL